MAAGKCVPTVYSLHMEGQALLLLWLQQQGRMLLSLSLMTWY